MTSEFKKQIDDIWPKYQEVIINQKYIDFIKEIRIEGHADTSHIIKCENYGKDNYFCNLGLSSKRSQNVLEYIRSLACYQDLPDSTKNRIQFLLTTNGLSYSKTLNSLGKYTYTDSDKNINTDLSRRVEFRIVTSNEKLVQSLKNTNAKRGCFDFRLF
jgi:outer membrane protein OmpA-like peptidoglycan-associated protein